MNEDPIQLLRDVDAVQIPSGNPVKLEQDAEVMITQSLGGSYTLATQTHGLVRIDAENADAIGLEVEVPEEKADEGGEADPEQVWDQLKMVYDPEIPVNIVDLGLVYNMEIKDTEEGKKRVEVQMTLTAPGCGMGPTIQADAKNKVLAVAGVDEAEVDLVWDPPWNQEMISEVGKMKLGMV